MSQIQFMLFILFYLFLFPVVDSFTTFSLLEFSKFDASSDIIMMILEFGIDLCH